GYGFGRARRTPAYQLRQGRMGGGSSIGQTRVGNKVSKSDLIQSVNLLSQYKKGEMVEHTAFGRGMIVSITPMGGDALVEIAFDNVGTTRLMLRSAAQHMQQA
ncbi:MAG: hypothetical protein LIO51_08130, partial [Clostridiales bacterium]|nr:hypothetical protein [Clostridiales bacterium]